MAQQYITDKQSGTQFNYKNDYISYHKVGSGYIYSEYDNKGERITIAEKVSADKLNDIIIKNAYFYNSTESRYKEGGLISSNKIKKAVLLSVYNLYKVSKAEASF